MKFDKSKMVLMIGTSSPKKRLILNQTHLIKLLRDLGLSDVILNTLSYQETF